MTATSIEKVNGHAPGFDAVALAKAEAIRTEAAAKAEAARIEAKGKADAEKIKAAEEARKQRIANDKAEARAREEQAARETRIAKLNRESKEQERVAREAEEQAAAQDQAEEAKAAEVAIAEEQWRNYALRFYAVCSIVALPVQIAAFYNPNALWLMAAPIMLEGGAWVVLKGARAAASNHRPHWHYRLIAWCLAFIAAAINLWHGLHAFDPATAIGTAFASIAGPGVYDLHEHGQIRKREGSLTRKERKAQAKAERQEAARKAAEEKRHAVEKEAAEEAVAKARRELAARRESLFPKVWEHAVKLAADLGETTVTEAIWKRAKLDVEGAPPGESAEVLRMRNAASARVDAAREKRSVNGSSQQVASQVLGPKKPRVYNPPARPGKRTKGDVKYTPGAARQASIAARKAAGTKDSQ